MNFNWKSKVQFKTFRRIILWTSLMSKIHLNILLILFISFYFHKDILIDNFIIFWGINLICHVSIVI